MSAWFGNVVNRYASFLLRRHVTIILVALALTILAALSAARFELKTDLAELLPQDEPSIKDLEKAKTRVGGLSNFIVAVMGDDVAANRRLVDDLTARFKSLPNEYLRFMKYNINEEKEFYEDKKYLFADLQDLEEIHRRLKEKIRYERIKNNPILNMDFDDEKQAPVEFNISDIKEKYEKKTSSYQRYIDGYLTVEEGRLFAILLYPSGASTGVDFGKLMWAEVKRATAEVCAGGPIVPAGADLDQVIEDGCRQRYHSSTRIGFSGGVVTAIVEQQAILDDIVLVTTICLILVALSILLFFRSWRSIPVIVVPLSMGTLWTFGISRFILGNLNTSTAFLASIIVGNGINFGIIQLARYAEERRGGKTLFECLTQALRFTAQSTATAALAASIAYGSLIVTRFRGFNGFGYMGGIGMILCWIAAFTVQPAILILLERMLPRRVGHALPVIPEGIIARPFARFVTRFGVPLHIMAGVFGIVCAVVAIPYLKDPWEYDFRNLRNQVARDSGAGALGNRVDKVFPRRLDPGFILADRLDQVPLIALELNRNNQTGPYQGVFQEVTSIYSFLPKDQEQKIKILNKIRKLLSESTLSWLSEKDRLEVEKYKPPADLEPLTIDSLPPAISRLFTELDGRKGLIVLLYPGLGRSVWDGHFLMQIADASRLVRLPDGEELRSAGVGTVFADMIRAIERDGPRAIVTSLAGVVLLVIVLYRSLGFVLLMLLSLVFGVVWTVGTTALVGQKLNFLNFIALPITFGIGIDYAVNTLNRYRMEGRGSIQRVIENTGGPVFLCALTTIIGYSSLLIADNQALVSFGLVANLGEFTTLAAALLFLPSVIQIFEKRRQRIEARVLQTSLEKE